MHDEAYAFVRDHVDISHLTYPYSVLDLGGRDINGSVRDLFPAASLYDVVDINPGMGVDYVADAADWQPPREYDVVVCCETFEHTARWREICATAFKALRPGGQFIATMGGPGRPAHSAIDGEFRLLDGEYYGNVSPAELWAELNACGFVDILVDFRYQPADTRAVAYRPATEGNAS